ncbi:hypothetical protein ABEB36_014277 [Hypothenemus hampei]|uniref:Uncharacterized protein n=1 Tax=Hypothenemus hampei TaxID=57062 RepID=A0ABD1E6N1_HYPHA
MDDSDDPGGGSESPSILNLDKKRPLNVLEKSPDWNKIMECEEKAENCDNVEHLAATGPYIVFIETQIGSSSSIGNFTHFKIAKEIFNLKLNNLIKYEIKDKNSLSIQFKTADAANEFCKNKILLKKGYNI